MTQPDELKHQVEAAVLVYLNYNPDSGRWEVAPQSLDSAPLDLSGTISCDHAPHANDEQVQNARCYRIRMDSVQQDIPSGQRLAMLLAYEMTPDEQFQLIEAVVRFHGGWSLSEVEEGTR